MIGFILGTTLYLYPHMDYRATVKERAIKEFNQTEKCTKKTYDDLMKSLTQLDAINRFYYNLKKLDHLNKSYQFNEFFKEFRGNEITKEEAIKYINKWYVENCNKKTLKNIKLLD